MRLCYAHAEDELCSFRHLKIGGVDPPGSELGLLLGIIFSSVGNSDAVETHPDPNIGDSIFA